MKTKYILTTILSAAFLLSACMKEDIDELRSQQAQNAERILSLEEWQKSINNEISAIQGLINALEANDYVTGVTPVMEGGVEVGYTITFSRSNPITIRHGVKGDTGETGQPGEAGEAGHSPMIGVAADTDGRYYWTLDSDWMLADGNKIPVTGDRGADGSNGKSAYDLAVEKGYTGTIDQWLQSLNGTNGQNGKSAYELAVEKGYTGTIDQWLQSLNGTNGQNGKSAYEQAVENGYTGTLQQWLESLKGADGSNGQDGQDGQNGKSAYDLAVEKGYTGTIDQWLQSLNGTNGQNGKSAYEQAVENGYTGTLQEWLESLKGADGSAGQNGKSAYEQAVDNGFTGTLQEWLESLKGPAGSSGGSGQNGKSAYEIAVEKGYTGTIDQWVQSLNGASGANGKSAYQLAQENGYTGTLQDWLNSLKGIDGINGTNGSTPKVAIGSDNFWYISTDGTATGTPPGTNWESTGVKATGDKGNTGEKGDQGDSFFKQVSTGNDDYVEFTLADDTKFRVPKYKTLGISFTPPGVFIPNATQTITYTVNGGGIDGVVPDNILIAGLPAGWKYTVDTGNNQIIITAALNITAGNYAAEAVVFVAKGDQNPTMYKLPVSAVQNFNGVAENSFGGIYYQNGIPTGVVYIPNDGSSGSGRAVSLTEGANLSYGIQVFTGSTSQDSGRSNMVQLLTIQFSFNSFPAFNWVHSSNPPGTSYTSDVEGIWYLPSVGELLTLYDEWKDSSLNQNITDAGGVQISPTYYWSSTEIDDAAGISLNFAIRGGTSSLKNTQLSVRAILAF